MKFRRPLPLFAAMLAIAGFGSALIAQLESGDRGILPLDSSGVLEVGGIHVDIGGETAEAARYAGWREAQRIGFRMLWAKANNAPLNQAPAVDDATLDDLVSSISIEKEQIGPGRYIADLGVLFDRSRAASLVGMAGDNRRSEPMLLMPVMISGGTPTALETRNAWQRAWASFRTSTSAIDYVRPSGLGVDPLLVNAAQVDRPGRAWWRNILDYYGAADILVAQVEVHRLFPGGPASAHFVARHGPDGEVVGSFDIHDRDGGDLQPLMNKGAQQMDQLFTAALNSGRLHRDRSLNLPPAAPSPEEAAAEQVVTDVAPAQAYQLLVAAPDAAWLSYAIGSIRSVPGVDSVTETSVALGGTSSVVAAYHGDISALRAALMARGWSVDYESGQLRLSRSAGSTAPTAPSAPLAPQSGAAPPPRP
ncbi:heavy-metal-associated domain-containing protein [Sphingomonas sp.]|uniref:heavy-metal-associated domain-containing protein n=1 Tax=Sphingomonas sp. TaxID=28214 RepID=UPI0025DD8B3C|nr:heavy-metal-associated domain-containing protein [Sphingomonas sp.]